jgi:uncharacterized glyoxalase superfamily protein PhnB
MVAHGSEVLVPIEDRPYGRCEGRVRDPFGHLWIPSHGLGASTQSDTDRRGWSPGLRRIVADLPTNDAEGVADFYRDVLALDVLMDHGWVITLGSSGAPGAQVTLISADHSAPSIPAISVEVRDLDGVLQRAMNAGHPIIYPRTREPWGVERFFVEDPARNIVNILRHIDDQTTGT